jgi:hypothetical protein
MTMACKICNHPKRLLIDRELVAAKNISGLAKKYDVPRASLDYHKANHLTRQLLKAQDTRDLLTAERLTDDIEFMLNAGKEIFSEARKDKSHCWSLAALREVRETWKFVAQVAFMMNEEKEREEEQQQYYPQNLSIEELELFQSLLGRLTTEKPSKPIKIKATKNPPRKRRFRREDTTPHVQAPAQAQQEDAPAPAETEAPHPRPRLSEREYDRQENHKARSIRAGTWLPG